MWKASKIEGLLFDQVSDWTIANKTTCYRLRSCLRIPIHKNLKFKETNEDIHHQKLLLASASFN